MYVIESHQELAESLSKSLRKILTELELSNQKNPDVMLTTSELCSMLSISRTQSWVLRKKGLLPYFRFGNKVMFSQKEVLESLTESRIPKILSNEE